MSTTEIHPQQRANWPPSPSASPLRQPNSPSSNFRQRLGESSQSHLSSHFTQPGESSRAFNTFSSAYVGKSSRSTLSRSPSEYGDSLYGRSRIKSCDMPTSNISRPHPPLQSRVYGLSTDLRALTLPSSSPDADGSKKTTFSSASANSRCNFSVELFASSFDERGYPILSGRAASIKGIVRMPAQTGCDVLMKISAHTTTGTEAPVRHGVAFAPTDLTRERKVFQVKDHLVANFDLVRPRQPYAPRNEDLMEPPTLSRDDFVLPIPFDVSLPVGRSSCVVDGELQAVAVSLPPSFEISSKLASQQRRETRLATKGKSKTALAMELVEKGFEKVFRIGCYYQITWTLLRNGETNPKQLAEADSLTLPFIFLGEPTTIPPPPATIPSTLSPAVFTQPGLALGDGWEVHRSTAKWSGSLIRASRKTVDIELHLPGPPIVQSPCHLPVMIILRPADPNLLSAVSRSSSGASSSTPGSPTGTIAMSETGSPGKEGSVADDAASIRTGRSLVAKFMRPSLNLARLPRNSQNRRSGGSSFFSSRRPNTAPSTSSSETGATETMTDRTVTPSNGMVPDLASLVCVSLVQTTYASDESLNNTPEKRRKIVSVADLEEVDVHALLLSSDSPHSEPGRGRTAQDLAAINQAAAAAKAAGVRILVGSLTVNQLTPPSFRCQGLEVKYAIKLDLFPVSRLSEGEGIERALKSLGIRSERSRGFSEGGITTASAQTRTQFTQLSNEGSTPPTTPPSASCGPNFDNRSSGSESTFIGGVPFVVNGSPQSLRMRTSHEVGMAISTTDESAVPAELAEPIEILSPEGSTISRFPSHLSGRSTPGLGPSFSPRSGWGSGQSSSDYSHTQASSVIFEWGKDRKTVSKLHKTIGELWIDVRMVRAQAF